MQTVETLIRCHRMTPHSVASGLGLHCLPMSHRKDARLIWLKANLEAHRDSF